MKMDKLIRQRFAELAEKAKAVAATRYDYKYTAGAGLNNALFREWATNVLNLLQHVFTENGIHYLNFYQMYKGYNSQFSAYEACNGVFKAAKEDYEGGYLFNIHSLIKAEILADDVLEQATELLKAGYKDPACVLAGVALESTLKELCTREGIAHSGLDRMNIDLCKAGVYNLAKQKQFTAWAHHRNKAAHGEWDEYTNADVDSFIKGVTGFIADYL